MSTINLERSSHHLFNKNPRFFPTSKIIKSCSLNCTSKLLYPGGSFCNLTDRRFHAIKAGSSSMTAVETTESADIFFKETFPLRRTVTVEGKISIRLDDDLGQDRRQLTVGCTLPGKWTLHWGVNYVHEIRSEWDQPPPEMLPPGTIPIKDFAVESPLKNLSSTFGEDTYHEVKIDIDPKSEIAAINFVLKDEITGAWHQHNGRDFKIALVDYLQEDSKVVGTNKGFGLGRGDLANGERHSEGFYKEHSIVKQVAINNSLSVSVRKCPETSNNMLYLETDIPGDVVVHWGVCRSDAREWEIPATPHPPKTELFKKKALQTLLELKEGGCGSQGLFTVDEEFVGFLFVLKLNGNVWLRCMGNDFYVPLSFSCNLPVQSRHHENTSQEKKDASEEASHVSYTDGIINEIRNLVAGISSEKKLKTRTKQAQESILHEIEKLAAEAYSIFRKSVPTFSEAGVLDSKAKKPLLKFSSGTGSGFEILCQGFNWESHKSGKWYVELKERAPELSSLGFTVVWLPPPTESVSPEGYMPKDLYNLNSRYGTIGELKVLVNCFHELGIKVLGDAVLNHRCAHYQNQNGVWNIFGGQLNWDDRAVVADDPHFQGRGNKSSGDNFHAAPNIDHSQEFVRKDIKEWLCWLRKEIGYDGWRLDFVRGFWGGYVKDYMDASEPYFAVGEYWDSLSYTYGEMDHNQDAHRQRIIDWINATNGTAGAFDVTTKGVLHSALERCEYWRLSDEKGKPPGVVGWWPSRAVTFIENHDTGSTQGHWRFPRGKEMQGYAYILTHPGTPAVFYDHVLSHYRSEISSLLSLRNRNRLHCRSTVKIIKAERDVYAAVIDEKVTMKIGPGYFEPPSGSKRWRCAIEGGDYKVWELEES